MKGIYLKYERDILKTWKGIYLKHKRDMLKIRRKYI